MAATCIIGRTQANEGSLMLWAMYYMENLGSGILVDATLVYGCSSHTPLHGIFIP